MIFSSSPTDYREPTHVNVHPPEHWAERFARHGFFRDVDFDASAVTAWAARFRRRREPAHRVVRDYERRYSELRRAETDARTYALETERRLGRAEEDLAGARAGLTTAAENMEGLSAAYNETCAAYRESQERLAQARDRIVHMERSLFWKARGVWVKVKGLAGVRDE